MACYTITKPQQTIQERKAEAAAALKRLEAALLRNVVTVDVGPNGAIVFQGWEDRDGLTDVCAYRSLTATSSHALKMAVARAEFRTGRKVNPATVAAGVHSHDGGRTWGKH